MYYSKYFESSLIFLSTSYLESADVQCRPGTTDFWNAVVGLRAQEKMIGVLARP